LQAPVERRVSGNVRPRINKDYRSVPRPSRSGDADERVARLAAAGSKDRTTTAAKISDRWRNEQVKNRVDPATGAMAFGTLKSAASAHPEAAL
jgi:hypothetical protein